ncbi:MAG: DMT family transporter [Planctomycetota bacterium]
MSEDSSRPYVWMLLGSVCFASMATLTNAASAYFPWQLVAMTRSVVPFILIVAWAISAGVALVVWRPGVLWLRSISGSLSLVSTFFALSRLPAPEVFTITNMFPLWIAILSWPMLGERPSLTTWIGVLCGLAGIFVLHPPNLDVSAVTVHDWPALVALFASVSTAFAMLGLNRLKHLDTRAVVVHFSFTALVFATGSYFLFDRPPPVREPNLWALAAILGTGLSATVGQMFLTMAFTSGKAAKVAVVNLSQIPMTLLLQILFFEYELTAQKVIGMALIVAPTAWFMVHAEVTKMSNQDGA